MGIKYQIKSMGIKYQIKSMGIKYQIKSMGIKYQIKSMGIKYQIKNMSGSSSQSINLRYFFFLLYESCFRLPKIETRLPLV
jgi:uncharacterized protein YqgV (UPF0045/DUF77 family)